MSARPRSATSAAVNNPDRSTLVVRQAVVLEPAAAWLDAALDVAALGPAGLLSGLLRAVNRLLLWPEPTSEGVWRF